MFEKMVIVSSTPQLFPSRASGESSHENRRRRNGYSKGVRTEQRESVWKEDIDLRRLGIQTFLIPFGFPIPVRKSSSTISGEVESID